MSMNAVLCVQRWAGREAKLKNIRMQKNSAWDYYRLCKSIGHSPSGSQSRVFAPSEKNATTETIVQDLER